jgi:hypothetical protein
MGDEFADEDWDAEWHAAVILEYFSKESGPGKSVAWGWGGSFKDARAMWIAAEVDLHAQRLGYKGRIKPVMVKVERFWEEDDEELVRIEFEGAGELQVKLTTLCSVDGSASSILLEIQHQKKGYRPKMLRTEWLSVFHLAGQVIRKGGLVRINRSLQLGACPAKTK